VILKVIVRKLIVIICYTDKRVNIDTSNKYNDRKDRLCIFASFKLKTNATYVHM
jgi:hypothetical protein